MNISKATATPINGNDVLFGRGGKTASHVGNVRFREECSLKARDYLVSKKALKSVIAKSVVKTVQERGGRFLERESCKSDLWIEVSDERAISKASQALREKLDVRNGALRVKSIVKSIGSKPQEPKVFEQKGFVLDDMIPDEIPSHQFDPFAGLHDTDEYI